MPDSRFSELQEGFSERSLPHSVEAEQSVLGSILLSSVTMFISCVLRNGMGTMAVIVGGYFLYKKYEIKSN